LQKLDLADLHSYEEAKNLSIALLEDWLTKYKFKDWKQTETRRLPVTDAMKRERAKEIAEFLSDHRRWHSHGRPISMAVLEGLNVNIDNLETKPDLHQAVRRYFYLLDDYMTKIGKLHAVHTPGAYL
jgi:hypothetical protein